MKPRVQVAVLLLLCIIVPVGLAELSSQQTESKKEQSPELTEASRLSEQVVSLRDRESLTKHNRWRNAQSRLESRSGGGLVILPSIKTDRLKMYYEVNGEGHPLLLIRGLGSTCEGFKAQVEGLSPHFRIISFDNRCVGRTDQPQKSFTIADMADDTAALLDSLGVASTHVFGVSLGGMVAQELALRHPTRVRRLALACTHAGPERLHVRRNGLFGYSLSREICRDRMRSSIQCRYYSHERPLMSGLILSVRLLQ